MNINERFSEHDISDKMQDFYVIAFSHDTEVTAYNVNHRYISEFNGVLKLSCIVLVNRIDKKESLGLSYIRGNEFILRNEIVESIFQYGSELGYGDEEIEGYLASFDRNFFKSVL